MVAWTHQIRHLDSREDSTLSLCPLVCLQIEELLELLGRQIAKWCPHTMIAHETFTTRWWVMTRDATGPHRSTRLISISTSTRTRSKMYRGSVKAGVQTHAISSKFSWKTVLSTSVVSAPTSPHTKRGSVNSPKQPSTTATIHWSHTSSWSQESRMLLVSSHQTKSVRILSKSWTEEVLKTHLECESQI